MTQLQLIFFRLFDVYFLYLSDALGPPGPLNELELRCCGGSDLVLFSGDCKPDDVEPLPPTF